MVEKRRAFDTGLEEQKRNAGANQAHVNGRDAEEGVVKFLKAIEDTLSSFPKIENFEVAITVVVELER